MPTIVPISVSAYVADPMHIFAGPNDVWMVDYTSGLNQITTPGLVQSQINGISDQQAACYGPDGNIWVTSAFSTGRIAKIQTASPHTITYYTGIPSKQGICVGPDGNIWTVYGNTIRANNTSGAILISTVAPGSSSLRRICVGPDGNMWACDADNGNIYKITLAGVVTVMALLGGNAYDICTGPDGNLWVANLQHSVWQVAPAGGGTEFPLAGRGGTSAPWGICKGPDGNLWVADYGAEIWSVTPAGVGTYYETAALGQSYPNAICLGGDGNLYASDAYGTGISINKVWQVLFVKGGMSHGKHRMH